MRYIRTGKNHWEDIYEVIDEQELYWVVKDKKSIRFEGLIPKCNVVKQADKIEELFSAFVLKGIDLIHLNEEYTQYRFEGSDEWFDITDTELRVGICGAIWTDKGLIYVAKLNEKGEFELL